MKLRKLLALLALTSGVAFGQTPGNIAQNQAQPVESVTAVSAESSALVERLKSQVDPNYIHSIASNTEHSKRGRFSAG
jgi:hypothetical protein